MMRDGSMTWRCTRCGNEQSAAVNECLGCGAPSTEPPMPNGPLVAGTTLAIGRYRIDSVLGQGGFGITYRAVDTRLMRDVAIKEMFPDARPPKSIFVTYDWRTDFANYHANLEKYIFPALMGFVDDQDLKRFKTIEFIKTPEKTVTYTIEQNEEKQLIFG